MEIERLALRLSSWLNPFCRVLCSIGSVTLFAMMCLTVADILMRTLLNNPILGTVELTELMMVVIVFFTVGFTEMKDGHIKVDVFTSKLRRPAQILLDVVTQLLGCLLFALVTISVLGFKEVGLIFNGAAAVVSPIKSLSLYPKAGDS